MSTAIEINEEATYRKITWRLMPLLLICYIVAYLDRVNVGFAKLQMMNALGFSDVVYGLGAGIFFVGYFLFEVPSNVILHKWKSNHAFNSLRLKYVFCELIG